MIRAAILSIIALCICVPGQCRAQNLVPTIRLTSEETVRARQVTQDLKNGIDRAERARAAWSNFHRRYSEAHPELQNLRFSSDFRAAYAVVDDYNGWTPKAVTVELTPEEGRTLEALYKELTTSEESAKQAKKNWGDFQNELLVKHVAGVAPTGPGAAMGVMTLPGGKQYAVPPPWQGGIALTEDFRIAVPRSL